MRRERTGGCLSQIAGESKGCEGRGGRARKGITSVECKTGGGKRANTRHGDRCKVEFSQEQEKRVTEADEHSGSK